MNCYVVFVCVLLSAVRSAALMPSGWIVTNPTTEKDVGFGISMLHCKWSGNTITDCPNASRSYSGVANFNIAGATATTSTLRIPFTAPYPDSRDPICDFGFEHVPSLPNSNLPFHTVQSEQDYVEIYLHKRNSQNNGFESNNWSDVSLYFTVVCFGAFGSSALSGYGNFQRPQKTEL